MITARDILSTPYTVKARALAFEAWTAGNDAGHGFAPDDDIDGLEPISWFDTGCTDDILIYDTGDGELILVGDSAGPWGIRLS